MLKKKYMSSMIKFFSSVLALLNYACSLYVYVFYTVHLPLNVLFVLAFVGSIFLSMKPKKSWETNAAIVATMSPLAYLFTKPKVPPFYEILALLYMCHGAYALVFF